MQMDGDAQTSLQSNPTALEDWDLICKANPTTCTFKAGYSVPSGTTTATATSHVADGVNASIFTTGGSKDPQDLPNWRWKDGSVPDKDNLQHAFAARYEKTPDATHCPVATGVTSCSLLFFGSDRFDNSGDAQQGFWFFQKKVSLNADGTFSGVHTNGDVLIVSDFSNGGTVSIINVYKWLNGALTFLAGGDSSKCTSALQNGDSLCGIVNPGPSQVAPWLYTDKSGNSNYLQNEFYEAGINLSAPDINLGGECFSSFVAETRSSTSTTATLKDFVLGQFAVCEAGLTTTPSVGAGGVVLPGVPVRDVATIQGTSGGTPPTPTGSVTFSLCGPIASGVCTTGGTTVSTNALADSAPPAGEATATSDQVNTAASPLAPGRYCFRADWPGDTNYPGALTHAGTGDSECFVVQDTTSVSSAQDWLPNDTATVTATGGTALNGTLKFELFESNDCSGTAVTGQTYNRTLTNATSLADRTKSTDNSTYKVSADASVSWMVTFTPDAGSNVTGSSHCETTSLDLTN
jgi:hypothetical protein